MAMQNVSILTHPAVKEMWQTTRTLRTRNADGSASASPTLDAPATSTTAKMNSMEPKAAKSSTAVETEGGNIRSSASSKHGSKKRARSASEATANKAVKKTAAKKSSHSTYANSALDDEDRRKWLVWPPYAHVTDIPTEHIDKYKRLFLTKKQFSSTDLRSCVPGTRLGCKRSESMQGLDQVVAYRARYEITEKDPKTGEAKLKCVEPGWQDAHSGVKEVKVNLYDDVSDGTGKSVDYVSLGWVVSNDGEGFFGKRDGSGKVENNRRLPFDPTITASYDSGLPPQRF